MQHRIVMFLAMAVVATGAGMSFARADADDAKWIKQCVVDNAAEKQTPETVSTYCSCMTEKMASAETQSVSTWEKTHSTEQEACSKKANWVSK